MKMMIGALALAFAVPATGQATPAADPHAHHAQHQGTDHGKHKPGEHDCKQCCEKMKQQSGKMECMDKKSEAKPAAPASGHDGHAH
jgi:hypothetical protein